MTSRSRLLAVAFLSAAALAGCKLDLAQYEPKTDDQCDAGYRACGYKCVPQDDPATGCFEEYYVCNPCPGPAAEQVHMVPACDGYYCALACAPGWGDCDVDPATGCETDLSTTAAHCGACGHACGSCTDGLCPVAQVGADLAYTPVDIDQVDGAVFVIDQGSGGALRKVDPVAHVDLATGLGTVRRLTMATGTQGWISGTWVSSGTTYGALFRYPDVVISFVDGVWVSEVDPITDFALTPTHVVYSVPGRLGYDRVSRTSSVSTGGYEAFGLYYVAFAADPSGEYEVYAGGSEGGLYQLNYSGGGSAFGYGGVAKATRIATIVDLDGYVDAFSASATDGSVSIWGGSNYVERVIPGAGPTTAIDIASDTDGVYWCDGDAGVVRMWRKSDGAVYDVARGGRPVAVTSDATRVIWADAADNRIHSTAK